MYFISIPKARDKLITGAKNLPYIIDLSFALAEQGILIRQKVDLNEINSTCHFCYFLIKIRYKYD